MQRCPNLARLSRPPLYSHVHFCHPSPGSPSDLFMHKIGPAILDPTHPGAQMPIRAFPSAKTECFRLSAFPTALLVPNPDSIGSPARPVIDTWANRTSRAAELQTELASGELNALGPSRVVAPPVLLPHPRLSIPMLLYFAISKAKTHKHAVKRRRLRTKLNGAINLIVTRGAHRTQLKPGVPQLEFNDEEVRERGDKWILPNWAYICHPTSTLYLIPYTKLVPQLRSSLHEIWAAGTCLEKYWAENELRKQKGQPLLASTFGIKKQFTNRKPRPAGKPPRTAGQSTKTRL